MIDNFSILLSHVLIAIAFFILMNRNDLDYEDPPEPEDDDIGIRPKPSTVQNTAAKKPQTVMKPQNAMKSPYRNSIHHNKDNKSRA